MSIEKYPFKVGDKLRCIAARDMRNLTVGNIYEAKADTEEGIFPDRPFIRIVADDDGKSLICHARRFEKVED